MADILLDVTPAQAAVLRSRSEDLSRSATQDQVNTEGQVECLFFTVSGVHFALARDWIQEVHLEVRPVPVPGTPSFVKGIVNVRGDIVSVVDLAAFLGLSPLPHQREYQMFRLRHGKLEFGVLCEQIENIQTLELNRLHSFEHGTASKLNQYLIGVTSELVNVLDASILLADESLIVR